MLKLLVIAGAISSLNPAKDTSISILSAAAKQGWELYYATINDLFLRESQVYAHASELSLSSGDDWYCKQGDVTLDLVEHLDLVMLRTDPPVDAAYVYATQLLDIVTVRGVAVVNNPSSLRDCNEKLFAQHFSSLCPPTLVCSQYNLLAQFLAQHQQIILKPLNAMGGSGVFYVSAQDVNFKVICEQLSANFSQAIIAQKFVPSVSEGDKRVLLINGQPLDYALLRVPAKGSIRSNLAVGGCGVAQLLSARDKEICVALAPELQRRGLVFVGLDIIGDYLIEVNITSPTGAVQIKEQTGVDAGDLLIFFLQRQLQKKDAK